MSTFQFTADPAQFDRSAPIPTPADFDFPHPPYAIQQQFMAALFECIDQRAIGIFESPTGTGKSLSLMCAALRWLRSHERVFRQSLQEDIAAMQSEIGAADAADGARGTGDWLTAQSGTIELKQRLAARKQQLEEVKRGDAEHQRRRERHRGLERAKVLKKGSQSKRAVSDNKTESLVVGVEVAEDEFVLRNEDDDDDDDEDGGDREEESNRNELPPRKPHQPQIFFCSRTHSQLSQVVHEVRKTSYARDDQESGIRVAVLASRQSYCINPAVRQLSSSAQINERCLEMQKCKAVGNSKATKREPSDGVAVKRRRTTVAAANCRCEHYSQPRIAQMRDHILSEVLDIEELVGSTSAAANGTSNQTAAACPYYAARLAATDAQLVMLPYQMLLHRRTRHQMRLDLRDSVVIIDEGHNLLDTLAAMHSAEVRLDQLQHAHRQLLAYKAKYFERFSTKNLLRLNQLLFVSNRLVKLLEKGAAQEHSRMLRAHELMAEAEFDHLPLAEILEFCERSHLAQKVHGFALKFGTAVVEVKAKSVANKTSRGDYLKRLAEKRNAGNMTKIKQDTQQVESPVSESPVPEDSAELVPNSSVIRPLLAFLDCLLQVSEDGRVLISCAEPTRRALKYLLLNPAASFADILADCRSIVSGSKKGNSSDSALLSGV